MKTTLSCWLTLLCCACYSQDQHKLLAGDGAAGDIFGNSVDVSGTFAIIGASQDDDNGTKSGAAYIFEFNGTSWAEIQKLVPTGIFPNDQFGTSVAISGNLAIVGAPYNDNSGSNSGTAYVFRYNGASWVEEDVLYASDAAIDDEFGFSVDIENTTAVVGAYRNDAGFTNSGAAYVFEYNGTNWPEEDKLIASDGNVDDFFSYSVALYGDLIAVGAYLDDDLGVNSGSVYVFNGSSGSWIQEQKIVPANGSTGDAFGFDVAIDNDLLVIGAYAKNNGTTDDGSVYLYRNSGTWLPEDELTASDGSMDDWFGYSVSVSGNLVISGAFHKDDLGLESGGFYLYGFDGSDWIEELIITATDGAFGDQFGQCVAINGYVTIAGAINEDANGTDAGAAYVYDICTYRPVQNLCLATVDSISDKNLVMWKEPYTSLIDSFSVYKTTGGSTLLATYGYSVTEQHLDNTSAPWSNRDTYIITTENQCSNSSNPGTTHSTIHLEANPNGGNVDLTWTACTGFSFSYYRIWRDSLGNGDYQLLWATLASQLSWTDANPPGTPGVYYLIEVQRGVACNPTWSSSISNISNPYTVGVPELTEANSLHIFPNPVQDRTRVNLTGLQDGFAIVLLFDVSGKEVYQSSISLSAGAGYVDLTNMGSGMYIAKVISANNELLGTTKLAIK